MPASLLLPSEFLQFISDVHYLLAPVNEKALCKRCRNSLQVGTTRYMLHAQGQYDYKKRDCHAVAVGGR